MLFTRKHTAMVDAGQALPGRAQEMPIPQRHEVLGTPLKGPFPDRVQSAVFGMGCFWGAERIFWEAEGVYQQLLRQAGHGEITTEIAAAGPFYYAEAYHQQYLAKNPGGYCGLGGTGVACPVGVGVPSTADDQQAAGQQR